MVKENEAKETLNDKSLKETWKPFNYKDYNGDEVVTVVLTDKRFEPLSNKHQREILDKHNVRIEVNYLNGTVVTGRVSDIIQACIECHIMNPSKIFEDFVEEVCCDDKSFADKEFIKENLEEPINEELKVIADFSDYTPWSGAVDTYDVIERAGKLDELEAYLESVFPDGATTTQINDLLWFDGEEVLEDLGLAAVEAEDEMSDQELAEKLWNAHCEKLKSKK